MRGMLNLWRKDRQPRKDCEPFRDRKARITRWLLPLVAIAVFASACAGETTTNPSETPTTTTPPNNEDQEPTTDSPGTEDPTPATDIDQPSEEDPLPTPSEDPTNQPQTGPNIYEDPRGNIFLEFQQTYDRGNHPFTQVDTFCLAHDPATDRIATDEGITADFIRIGHIRSRLEEAEAAGFAVPLGKPKEMFEVFIDHINNECGGIRGRKLDLGYAEAALIIDADTSRNKACLAMTEDHKSVVVMNSTGFQGTANLCLTEEQETIFISTQGQTEEFMERSNDLLVSSSPTLEESLRFMVQDLTESGALDGLTLGVAAPNTPGQIEAVTTGLIAELKTAGFDVIFDVIDCGGSELCFGGVGESVANMRSAGVNGFFNVLNIISAPGYIGEMARQGFLPGEVQFFASDFNSQTSEIVASQIAVDEAAGNLYNGATIFDYRTTGDHRDPNFQPNPFLASCNELYSANSPTNESHQWQTTGSSAYEMVGIVCAIVRVMARALYDAGDNPTIADVRAALVGLGPVDNNTLTPASIRPGKTQLADVIQTLDFTFPCESPRAFELRNGGFICIDGRNDFRLAPR